MKTIYNKLLLEAKQSPMLLSDLAGLETYISESYTNRSFIELLQNADDAGATNFLVEKFGGYLIVANNGRFFNTTDIESLCRSASSSKVRGNSIGYRGIGFKSVVSVAKEIHIISGDFEITFSKEITHSIIPEAAKVPLIRIPHEIRISVKNELSDIINRLKANGYKTFFVFSGAPIEQIKSEYEGFSHTSLLFLNNIKRIDVKIDNAITTNVDEVVSNDNYKQKTIFNPNQKTEWRIYSEKGCSIVFAVLDGKPYRIKQEDSKIHAFLPTEDNTGLGVIINADFSTDPSRRHLIFDDITDDAIKKICALYHSILKKYIVGNDEESKFIINALMPYFDIRLVDFTNNAYHRRFSLYLKEFSTYLLSIKLPPPWMNTSDYSKINTENVNYDCFSISGFESFLKYFGCKTDDIGEILNKTKGSNVSIVGNAEIASYCIKQSLMNVDVSCFTQCDLFSSDNKLYSLRYINENSLKIDLHYLRMLYDNGVDERDLKIYFKKYSFDNILNIQFLETETEAKNDKAILKPIKIDENVTVNSSCNNQSIIEAEKKWFKDTGKVQESKSRGNDNKNWFESIEKSCVKSHNSSDNDSNSLHIVKTVETSVTPYKKWRSAEENALNVLNSNGFKLKDVSNNNVGYDLEGLDPNGNDIFIEVKSINYKGQSFRVTNNEFAVAQQKQESYYILLFLQKEEYVDLIWIKNPIKNLMMNRQCVQWVWVCNEYNYESIRVMV